MLLVELAGAQSAAEHDLWISGFRDVPAWAETAVTYAAHQNWISGVTVTTFRPDDPISADGWCTFLLRMLGYSDKEGDFTVSGAAGFCPAHRVDLPVLSGALTQAGSDLKLPWSTFFPHVQWHDRHRAPWSSRESAPVRRQCHGPFGMSLSPPSDCGPLYVGSVLPVQLPYGSRGL